MRGHIRQRGRRSWAVVIDLARDPVTGKRHQKWHAVKGTKRDAERELAELIHQLNTQDYAEPRRLTLARYLEEWLAHKATIVRPTTLASYVAMVRHHIVPALGNLELTELTALQVERWCRDQLGGGRADGRGQALTPRTVQYAHAVLSRALKHAVRLRLLARNVAEAAQAPRPEARILPVLGAEVAARLLDAARGTRLHLPILLAASTGMRRGEVLGLRWSDVDLDRSTAEIQQALLAAPGGHRVAAPKSAQGRRQVALAPALVKALKAHRKEQAECQLLLGPAYQDHDLVVCLEDGRPWAPTKFSHAFRALLRRGGLDHLRFHDLRHLHATVLLREGVQPKVVAERLGHSDVRLTLDTYSHVLPDIQREAAQAFESALAREGGRRKPPRSPG